MTTFLIFASVLLIAIASLFNSMAIRNLLDQNHILMQRIIELENYNANQSH